MVRGRPAPGRRPPSKAVIVAGLATAGALFALVSVQSLVEQTEIRKTEISKRIDHAKDMLEVLQVQVSNLSSLDRIEKRALQLGLVPPPAIAFLTPPDLRSPPPDLASVTVPSFVEPADGAPASAHKPSHSPHPTARPTTHSSAGPSAHPSPSPAAGGGR